MPVECAGAAALGRARRSSTAGEAGTAYSCAAERCCEPRQRCRGPACGRALRRPCLVGETAAAMCLGGKADDGDAELVRRLFDSVGKIYRWGAGGRMVIRVIGRRRCERCSVISACSFHARQAANVHPLSILPPPAGLQGGREAAERGDGAERQRARLCLPHDRGAGRWR